MAVTPAGFISIHAAQIVDMLANTAEWISWTSSANAVEARTHIILEQIPRTNPPIIPSRPFAIITDGKIRSAATSGGRGQAFRKNTDFHIVIESPTLAADLLDDADLYYRLRNHMGLVWDQIAAQANIDDVLSIESVEMVVDGRISERHQGEATTYQESEIVITTLF